MWEFSSGELCAHNTVKRGGVKERQRTAIRCPQQRMTNPVPLGRLCSHLSGSGRDPWAALVSFGSPTNSSKAELPPVQACHCLQGLQPVVICH